MLSQSVKNVTEENKATIFGYYVNNLERYGVVRFDENNAISIEKKQKEPKSNYVLVGLYLYPNSVVKITKIIKSSHRVELEITIINEEYLKQDKLKFELMGRGYSGLDIGTFREKHTECSL